MRTRTDVQIIAVSTLILFLPIHMLYYNLLLRTWEKFLPNSNADLSIEYFDADPQFMFKEIWVSTHFTHTLQAFSLLPTTIHIIYLPNTLGTMSRSEGRLT